MKEQELLNCFKLQIDNAKATFRINPYEEAEFNREVCKHLDKMIESKKFRDAILKVKRRVARANVKKAEAMLAQAKKEILEADELENWFKENEAASRTGADGDWIRFELNED